MLNSKLAATRRARLLPVLAALAAICASCGRWGGVPEALDPAVAACLTPQTLAVASVDLDRLRASAAMKELPSESAALLQPFAQTSRLAFGYDGKNVLIIAQGKFQEAPAGGMLISRGVAVFGASAAIEAARAQSKTGKSGAGWLLQRAAGIAPHSDLWAVAVGGTVFPGSGPAANLNPLMNGLDYATLAVTFDSPVRVAAAGVGDKPESASRFEETVRGLVSLLTLSARQRPEAADAARSVQVRRDNLSVSITFAVSPAQAAAMLGALLR